jgi:hypothetical protein
MRLLSTDYTFAAIVLFYFWKGTVTFEVTGMPRASATLKAMSTEEYTPRNSSLRD